MNISYKNLKIENYCKQQTVACQKFGPNNARKLRARLADMEAVHRVTELVAGNPHPLKHDRQGEFAITLTKGTRITFESDHDPTPRHADSRINWSQVTSIKIIYIGDYHD